MSEPKKLKESMEGNNNVCCYYDLRLSMSLSSVQQTSIINKG
jgi:hypothetical protein